MSGAEAGLVIGLISGIISIVDASKKVYDAAHDASGLPKAFQEVQSRLPLVKDTLQAVAKCIEEGNPNSGLYAAIKPLLEACKDKAQKLEEVFKKAIPPSNASHLDRYYRAVRALGKGSEVECLMTGILNDLDVIASNRVMRTATGAQIEEISKAIEDLEALPRSVPDRVHEAGFTNINSGSGPQNIHQGMGDQHNYTNVGGGSQYNAQSMSLGPTKMNKSKFYAGTMHVNLQSSEARKIRLPVSTVPFAKDNDFVPRIGSEGNDVLETITTWFDQKDIHIRAAIVGLGGIGKSQLAIEYSYRLSALKKQTSVFWISARNRETFTQSYQSIIRKLEIPGFDNPHQDPLVLLSEWLADSDSGPWLMILDNADDLEVFFGRQTSTQAEQPVPTLAQYIPQVPHGNVLITSRYKTVVSTLSSNKYIIKLRPMNEDEAVHLLQKKLFVDNTLKGQMKRLAQQLDYIPLAITQAASYICTMSPRMTLERYLLLYGEKENQSKLLSEDNGDIRRDPGIPNSVIKTWEISFVQIQNTMPSSSELLSFMAVLDRQSIPEFLLLKRFASQLDFENSIGALMKFSLIDALEGSVTFSMHRLVQMATREWLKLNKSLEEWQGRALEAVSQVFPGGKFENWAICQALLPHAAEILQHNSQQKDLLLARATLLSNLSHLKWQQGQYRSADQYCREGLLIQEKFLPKDHRDILSSQHILALILKDRGNDKESMGLNKKLIETKKRVLGEEHPDTLTSMSNLALVFKNQGQWEKAEELNIQVIETRKRVSGPEHPDTLTSMSNLASVFENQGQWEKAKELNIQVMETRKRVLGPEHLGTLNSMNNLALTFRNQGQWKESKELNIQVIEIGKRVLGPEHPGILTSMSNLALTFGNQGQWKEAEELNIQVMETKKRVLDPEHPDTLTTMSNLALIFGNQGQWKKAEELNIQVIEIEKRVLGPEHPSTLTTMSNLALIFGDQRQWKKTEELNIQVMETRKRVLGPEHPDTLTSMNNLAHTWKSQGEDSKAIELMTSCADLHVKVLGIEHPYTKYAFEVLKIWRASQPDNNSRLSELHLSNSNTEEATSGIDILNEAIDPDPSSSEPPPQPTHLPRTTKRDRVAQWWKKRHL